MTGMFTMRMDKWVRVGSGFGLLLLLLAQEKVCPWLLATPGKSKPNTHAATPPSSEADRTQKKQDKKNLPHVLPDAPAPRWPASWSQTTLRQTTGARDGVVSRGRRDSAPSRSAWASNVGGDRWAWHRLLEPVEPVGMLQSTARSSVPVDPAVRTCISRTGPPRS